MYLTPERPRGRFRFGSEINRKDGLSQTAGFGMSSVELSGYEFAYPLRNIDCKIKNYLKTLNQYSAHIYCQMKSQNGR